MRWRNKVEEILKIQREQKEDPPMEERMLSEELEKGDMFAMIFSAFFTIFPICLGVILFMVLVVWLLFGL